MAGEIITELYRFNERNGTYSAYVHITYDLPKAKIKGLDSTISKSDYKEVISHLRTRGVTDLQYTHRKKDHHIKIKPL